MIFDKAKTCVSENTKAAHWHHTPLADAVSAILVTIRGVELLYETSLLRGPTCLRKGSRTMLFFVTSVVSNTFFMA